MPTATSFTALGKGNGFNLCLRNRTVPGERIINPATLKQAVAAYWNFHSASFSGASFEPGNQPRDLICTPTDAQGVDTDHSAGSTSETFSVSNGAPRKVLDQNDAEKTYYAHGISFEYNTSTGGGENIEKSTSVFYTSTVSANPSPFGDPIPYTCTILSTTTSGGGSYSIGKVARKRTVDLSSVTIDGLPFVKTVIKSFVGATFDDPVGSGNAECEPASFLSETTEVPSLTLWSY